MERSPPWPRAGSAEKEVLGHAGLGMAFRLARQRSVEQRAVCSVFLQTS